MRTTVRIDDELYRRVKQRAASQGRTVAAVLEDAVRVGMADPATGTASTPFVTPRYGRGGLVAGVDLSSNSSWRGILDEGAPLDQVR